MKTGTIIFLLCCAMSVGTIMVWWIVFFMQTASDAQDNTTELSQEVRDSIMEKTYRSNQNNITLSQGNEVSLNTLILFCSFQRCRYVIF